jgi:ribosomal protein S21
MSNVTRVRVEVKKKYNDPHKNFKEMFQEFKRRVSNAGILADYKDDQYFETKSQKNRMKKMAIVKRFKMEALTEKILNGERVKAPSGLIKKVLNSHKKENKKDSQSQERGFHEK